MTKKDRKQKLQGHAWLGSKVVSKDAMSVELVLISHIILEQAPNGQACEVEAVPDRDG